MEALAYSKGNCSKSYTDELKELIESFININEKTIGLQDDAGYSWLILASNFGQTEIVRKILEHSPAINLKTNEGITALHGALSNGFIEIAEELLKKHADLEANSIKGFTPIMSAIDSGKVEV